MTALSLGFLTSGERLSEAFPSADFSRAPKYGGMRISDKKKISALFQDQCGASVEAAVASDGAAAAATLAEVASADFAAMATALTRRTLHKQELQTPWTEQISALEEISDKFPRMREAALLLVSASLEFSSPEISDCRKLARLLVAAETSKASAAMGATSLVRVISVHAEISDQLPSGVLREAVCPESTGVASGTRLVEWLVWCVDGNGIFGTSDGFRTLHATNFLNLVMRVIGNFGPDWPQIPGLATNLPRILRPLLGGNREISTVLWASEELALILRAFLGMFPVHLPSFLEILGMLGEKSGNFMQEISVQHLVLPRNFQQHVESVEDAVLKLYGFTRAEISGFSPEYSVFALGRKFLLDGNFLWSLVAAGAQSAAIGNFLTEAQKTLVAGALEISGNLGIFPESEETELWMARNLGDLIGNFPEIWLSKSSIPLKLVTQMREISDKFPDVLAAVVERTTKEELARNFEARDKLVRLVIGKFSARNFRLAAALRRKSAEISDLLDENSDYAIRGRELLSRGRGAEAAGALAFLSEISWRSDISSLVLDAMHMAATPGNLPDAPRALKALLASPGGRNFRLSAVHAELVEKILAKPEISDCVAELFARPGVPQRLQTALIGNFCEADAALAAFLRVPGRDCADFPEIPASLVPKFAEGCLRLLARALATATTSDARKAALAKAQTSLDEFAIGNFFRDANLALAVAALVKAARGDVKFPISSRLETVSAAFVISECKKFPIAAATALETLGEWAAVAETGESEISWLGPLLGSGESAEFFDERVGRATSVLAALLGGKFPGKKFPLLVDYEKAGISDLQPLLARDRTSAELVVRGVAGTSEGKFLEIGTWLGTWVIGNFAEFPDAGLLFMWRASSVMHGNFREMGIRFVQTWREKLLALLAAATSGTVDDLGRATLVTGTLRALGLPLAVEQLIGNLGASENLEFPVFFCRSAEQKIAAGVLPSSLGEEISEPATAPSVLHQTATMLVVRIFEDAILSGESEISFDLCLEIVARLKNLLVKRKSDPQGTLVLDQDERVPLSVDKFVAASRDALAEKKVAAITDVLSLFEVKKRTSDANGNTDNLKKTLKPIEARNIARFPTISESLTVTEWIEMVGNVAMVALLRAYETATKEVQVLSLFDLMEILKNENVLKGKAEIALDELLARLRPHIFLEDDLQDATTLPALATNWTEPHAALPW